MSYEINGAQLVSVNKKLRTLHDKEIGAEFRTHGGKLLKHFCIEQCHCGTAKLWRLMLDLPFVQTRAYSEFTEENYNRPVKTLFK